MHWPLRQDRSWREHLPEQLVIEVVAICQEHQGGVAHARVAHGLRGVEQHLNRLARALRVPDNARTPVTFRAGGFDGLLHGGVDGPVLVVLRHPLHQAD